ncbi:uncharacterized protein LOC116251445 isoform X1 [Nymphaea colorata]|nr:uncharacterized protein LOC116251445 isoform X1 [Nymphaea colorata]
MEDFEPPSFSLGFDALDEDQHRDETPTRQVGAPEPSFDLLLEDEGQEEEDPPPPVLKRLKRGPSSPPRPRSAPDDPVSEVLSDADDEIENFSKLSSPEDRCKAQKISVCSSSKISLRSQSVLTSQSTGGSSVKRSSAVPKTSILSKSSATTTKSMLSSAFNSPLRRIQLLDSDSDEPSPSKDTCRIGHRAEASVGNPKSSQSDMLPKTSGVTASSKSNPLETFWKDFNEKQPISLATPALDEFCQEHFSSTKGKEVVHSEKIHADAGSTRSRFSGKFGGAGISCSQKKKTRDKEERFGDLCNGIPPACRYFYHHDPRIRNLVSGRLANFRPLGYENNGTNDLAGERVIDYMSQFGQKETPVKVTKARGCSNRRSSSDSKKSSKAIDPLGTTGWVNPKSSATVPRDAGKRRVQAVGSAGHWYTGQDGRKVYVSKSGQELTGRVAYSNYRKESGKGFKKRKKPAAKKKSK